MAVHIHHYYDKECCLAKLVGGFLVLCLIGWLVSVVPGWVWWLLLALFIVGACTSKK